MQLTLLTPHRKLLDQVVVDELSAPGFRGELGILEGHANLVTQLETGVLRWKSAGAWNRATISFGLLEVFNGQVTVLADVSELSSDVDMTRARDAESRARRKIEEGGLEDADFRKQELKLKRAMARVSSAES